MIVLILLFAAGCAHHTAQKPTSVKPSVQATIPLPDWAPKNPSPEFLRAAKVIKPWGGPIGERGRGVAAGRPSTEAYSPDVPRAQDDVAPDLAGRAWSEKYHRTLVAAWEFFGTLTGEEIDRFVRTKKVRLLAKDLNPKQRAAMYHYFDVWRETMKGVPVDLRSQFDEDWLVDLYKLGAKQDLSNVEITFDVRTSHIVRMMMRAQLPGGKLSPPLPAGLGQF
jgi:uncharacterized protein YcgL (UPF0745 family)